MADKKPAKQVGALWEHAAKQEDQDPFMTGVLELGALGQIPIVVFRNNRKEKENQPDFRILLSERNTERNGGGRPANSEPGKKQAASASGAKTK